MAIETGTATNYLDFWNKLISFLTTNTTLVAAGQQWSTVWTAPTGAPNLTDRVLKGPGLAGEDAVYIGLRLVSDVAADRFAIHMTGMTGVLSGATQYDAHTNCPATSVRMFLGNTPMTYWFVANGRRFIAVAKVSTVYEAMYGGLILPYSPPSSYPYPLFIGGTAGETSASVDWRSVTADHSMFHLPRMSASIPTPAWLLDPTGSWQACGDEGSSNQSIKIAPDTYFAQAATLGASFGNSYYGYKEMKDRIGPAYGGQYTLTPFTLIQGSPTIQTYGVLHGAYHVPGRGNSAENIVSYNGVNHLVLQNVYDTSIGEYLAIALEA